MLAAAGGKSPKRGEPASPTTAGGKSPKHKKKHKDKGFINYDDDKDGVAVGANANASATSSVSDSACIMLPQMT